MFKEHATFVIKVLSWNLKWEYGSHEQSVFIFTFDKVTETMFLKICLQMDCKHTYKFYMKLSTYVVSTPVICTLLIRPRADTTCYRVNNSLLNS